MFCRLTALFYILILLTVIGLHALTVTQDIRGQKQNNLYVKFMRKKILKLMATSMHRLDLNLILGKKEFQFV